MVRYVVVTDDPRLIRRLAKHRGRNGDRMVFFVLIETSDPTRLGGLLGGLKKSYKFKVARLEIAVPFSILYF